jgi:metal-responsive CopG/Arc/MetJ family transcriptional regulator
MAKVLISIPDKIASRMRASIPKKQRSKVIVQLIEKEIEKREKALYECALAVEQDHALNQEMNDWVVN